jgi:hypothetical protein
MVRGWGLGAPVPEAGRVRCADEAAGSSSTWLLTAPRAHMRCTCFRATISQGVLDERLKETGENWRLVYKSLLLLEYMCKHGPLVRAGERARCGRGQQRSWAGGPLGVSLPQCSSCPGSNDTPRPHRARLHPTAYC